LHSSETVLTFCGVNAHHQNGIAERHIRSITERAHSMLIHAMIAWPDIISEQLWPFALPLAMDLHNHTPGSSGLSPVEIFSGVKSPSTTIRDFHPFRCPIFVLDPSLQQGHKIPCWKPRSRVGVYLGFSPNHASSVPLVLSTTTGLVSPQFHVVYNDLFMATNCLQTNTLPDTWSTLLTTSSCKYVNDTFTSTNFIDPIWFQDDVSTPPASSEASSSQREESTSPLTSSLRKESTSTLSLSQREGDQSASRPGWNASHTYATRFRQKFMAYSAIVPRPSSSFDADLYSAFISVQDSYPIHSTSDLPFLEHLSCAAGTNPDVLHYGAMLKDADKPAFEQDMIREVNDLLHSNTVELSLCSSIPSNT
jgi:hypothetical protein